MKISEVAEMTGLDVSAVRFYERKGLITPARAEGSTYRSYSEEDVSRLRQIVLFRKMNLPIETIRQLLKKSANLQDVLKMQEADLLAERERLEGSLDLCRKMIEDHVSDDGFDLNYYLNYVREEEEQGRTYPGIMDTLDGIAYRSVIEKSAGIPFLNRLFINKWMRSLAGVFVFIFLVIFPAVMVAEQAVEWRSGQIGVQRLLVWISILLIYWGTFVRIVHGK